MPVCPKCALVNFGSGKFCKRCGSPLEVTKDTEIFSSSKYNTARTICMVISFAGWLIVVLSFFAFLIVLLVEHGSGVALFIPLAGIVMGLPMVLFGQLTQAVIDTADYLREILTIMKSKQ